MIRLSLAYMVYRGLQLRIEIRRTDRSYMAELA